MNFNYVQEKLSNYDSQIDSINLVPATFDNTNQIGQGTFGKVYKSSYYTKDNELKTVAIKKISMSSQNEGLPLTAVREISILKSYHHPNLVELLDIVIAPVKSPNFRGHVDLVFEYMEHDINALVESKIQFTAGQIKNIMRQILSGIAYLHSNNIIHRDIKSANILLNNKGVVKLGDFGLARTISPIVQRNKQYSGNVVTIWYRPPELLLGMKNYDLKVDMWSIGCVFAELLMGEPIFKGNNEKEQIEQIFKICGSPNEMTWHGVVFLPDYDLLTPKNTFDNNLKIYLTSKSSTPIDDITFDLIQKMLKVEPEKQDINIGEYLLNQKNKVSLFSIASYLSLDTKLNLFSISKQFKPYLANEIDNLKHNFEDANSITLSSKIIDKKADLKIRFRDEELHGATIPFTPSRGAVKAVELLNEELYNRIYRQNELKEPLNKIIFIYRIYMQLLGKNDITSIKNDNLFWKEFTKFILDNNNGKTGNFYNESVKDFVFTSENIYKIRRIVGNKVDEIKPTNYSKLCGTTGLVIFLIKDALEYCGIMQNDKKNIPSLLMKNLEYLEHIENKISSYIAFLNK